MSNSPARGEPDGAAEEFDRYAASYTGLHEQNIQASGETPTYFAEYKRRFIERHGAPVDAPLLDFGCGVGNVTVQLAEAFEQIHAYEPAERCLEVVRRRLPTITCHAAIDSLPRGHFATALMSGVLHHVPPADRPELLRDLRSFLRPGGRLFVFEHNPFNPLTRHAVATCPFDENAILVRPGTARRLVAAAGFDDPRVDHIVFFPRRLAALRRFEPRLRWLPIGAQYVVRATRA